MDVSVGSKKVRHRGGDAAPDNGDALGDAAAASGGADLFASFFFSHSTPDAVRLLSGQSVGPALLDNRAGRTDRLGVCCAATARGAALTLGVEEQLGVQVSARRFVLQLPCVNHGSGQTGDVSHWVPPSCLSCRHFRHTMSARIDTCAVVIQGSFSNYEPVLRLSLPVLLKRGEMYGARSEQIVNNFLNNLGVSVPSLPVACALRTRKNQSKARTRTGGSGHATSHTGAVGARRPLSHHVLSVR